MTEQELQDWRAGLKPGDEVWVEYDVPLKGRLEVDWETEGFMVVTPRFSTFTHNVHPTAEACAKQMLADNEQWRLALLAWAREHGVEVEG